ncbi:AMP-dependent synthetase [Aurantiacibacter atlanticus]|uniref:AMP-dependent synthetase n=1 Tax=Aurantiacibacter atlanticus TaxID=1648404 RepID=A0A0H4VDY6_9SPHN|nr:AMP-dependent synthetase/ligase [Aurantiacibacter atlanticus]AKQ41071.1 AMP-dependent synthetase [Aurantiacibacter atlanticus]MDF1833507.1 AMP-dependent synthetase/ligase [Alteraurantiacibacter sp. bin_em_oilr2.035]
MLLRDIDDAQNLVSLFLKRADQGGEKPFLTSKIGGEWTSISHAETARQVCLMAEQLRSLGLRDGDRVVIVSENRPEWCIADLAIMAAGCITTPAYTTNTERDHSHILDDSGASAVIVSNSKLAKTLFPAIMQSGRANHVITIDAIASSQSGSFDMHGWDKMISGDAEKARQAVEQRMATIGRKDAACIIYTSGTSGAPRGVVQSHGAILCNVSGAAEIIAEDFGVKEERFLSFLPLSHAYEHTGGQFLPIGVGAEIWYSEGLEKLASNIEEARPTIMVVVPRLFEVLRARILKQVSKEGKFANYLMDSAISISQNAGKRGAKRLRDRPMDLLLERTLRPKIRQKFGGRLKAMVSGGAPLNPEVGYFFDAMGLTLLQGYGQTESGPVVSCNRPLVGLQMDSVGRPMRGVEVEIAEDGEILVRGELVMTEYWQRPIDTERTLKNGWLHTGDVGHLDDKGRIKITDRKKDIIVNDKGDNVAPQKLEGMLTLQPEISQAMVMGDKKPFMTALIVPDAEWALQWTTENDIRLDMAELHALPAFRSAVKAAIDRTNANLSVVEKVRKFEFADGPFTVDNDQMTPTLKIRRHEIRAIYQERMNALY